MSEDVIKAEGLTKVFNHNLVAVDHIDFSVKHGEIFGFLGPNGAGKTTTINMLITVLKPTEGTAYILGNDIAKQNTEVRNSIGVVSQVRQLPGGRRAAEDRLGEVIGVTPEIDDPARTSGPALEHQNPSPEAIRPGVRDELSQRRHLGEARGHLRDEGSDSNLGRRDLDALQQDHLCMHALWPGARCVQQNHDVQGACR